MQRYYFSIIGAGKFGMALAHVINKNTAIQSTIRLYDLTSNPATISSTNFTLSDNLKHVCLEKIA